jgi:hypothetical protein
VIQPVKGCYTAKVTYARRRKTVTPPNNGARALARVARRSSKNILADFLKAVLPSLAQQEFEELTIVDPHLKRDFENDEEPRKQRGIFGREEKVLRTFLFLCWGSATSPLMA